jgi:RHS repeat-associated protein
VAASFSYDARNRCMKRVINGTTTYLTYDGWSLLEERDAGDTLIHKYIHGAVIDEIIVRYNGSPVWYHHDALGSTTHVTDNTGTVVESYTYDVYGAPSFFDSAGIQQPVSSVQNRFLFTGRERLAEAGLYDYRNRFYSYVLGRFLQTDPIRPQASDINAYSYVRNSPIAYADPLGTYITYGSGGSASFWNELSGAYRRMWSTKAGKKLLNWAHALTLEVRICAWDENRHRTLRRSDTLVEILVPVNGTSHGHLAHELWHVAQYELGEARKGLLPVVEATDNSDPPAEPAVEWEAIRVQNIVSREYLELAHGGRIQHTPILNYPGIPGELQKPYGKYFE